MRGVAYREESNIERSGAVINNLDELIVGRVAHTVAVFNSAADAGSDWKPRWVMRDEVIACPWHGLEYHVPTGQCLAYPEITLRRYPVEGGSAEVIEYTLSWTENGVPHAGHHLHVLTVRDDRIVSDMVFCGGRWPAALLAEMEAAGAG